MRRFLRNYGLIGLLGLGATYGLLFALAPEIATYPWLAYKNATKGWHVLKPGPVRGIALALEDEKRQVQFPPEIDTRAGAKSLGEGTIHFVVELPAGIQIGEFSPRHTNVATATIVSPGGEISPARLETSYGRDKAEILIPPRYGPDCKHLDVQVELPDHRTSTFRLTHLANTHDFIKSKPLVEKMIVAGLNLEGAAFRTPSPGPHQFASLGGALRVTSLPRGERWEWRSPRLRTPFGVKKEDFESSGLAYADVKLDEAVGDVRTEQFARQISRVRLTGQLARYESIDEELDFGEVPVRLANDRGFPDEHKFRLAIASPLSRTTKSGFTLTIVPESHPLSFEHMTANWTFVCIIFQAGNAVSTGFSTADGEFKLAVGSDHTSELSLKAERPNGVPGEFMWDAKLLKSAKSFQLKVKVRRKHYFESHPFELVVPVRNESAKYAIKGAYYPETSASAISPDLFPTNR
jgi:hypothetical protein